jgi:hypothetical protein
LGNLLLASEEDWMTARDKSRNYVTGNGTSSAIAGAGPAATTNALGKDAGRAVADGRDGPIVVTGNCAAIAGLVSAAAHSEPPGGVSAGTTATTDALGKKALRRRSEGLDYATVQNAHRTSVARPAAGAAERDHAGGIAASAAPTTNALCKDPPGLRACGFESTEVGDRHTAAAATARTRAAQGKSTRGVAGAATAATYTLGENGMRILTPSRDDPGALVGDYYTAAVAAPARTTAKGERSAGGTTVAAPATDALSQNPQGTRAEGPELAVVCHRNGTALSARRPAGAKGESTTGVTGIATTATHALGQDGVRPFTGHARCDGAAIRHADIAAVTTTARASTERDNSTGGAAIPAAATDTLGIDSSG